MQGNEQVFRALASRQTELASLVTTFDRTLAAFAARQNDLSASIAALPPLLRTTNNALTALDASFGPTKTFAKEILPGIEQVDPTIGQALPWLAQATALLGPSELGGLVVRPDAGGAGHREHDPLEHRARVARATRSRAASPTTWSRRGTR